MSIAFVYANSRAGLAAGIERGEVPDSALLGANHLPAYGLDAFVHDPLLTRRRNGWLWWQLREVSLPLELRRAAAVVTPLSRALPLAARAFRGPRVLVLNFGLNTQLRRTAGARRRLVMASIRAGARIVCLAETQRAELLELAGLPESRVVTAHLGTDTDFFAPRGAPAADGPPLVLSVGKDLARDYETFTEALRDLPVRGHTTALPRNLARAALPPNLSIGRYDFPGLRAAYAAAACVVIPQYRDDHLEGTEAGGLTALLEAMAMARPIVATDRPAIREYVEHERSALLVPPEDPAALRQAIERIVDDGALAERLGAGARAVAEERLKTSDMAARLAPVIRETVER